MKKNLSGVIIALCSILFIAGTGCKKKRAVDCNSASQNITSAAQKYASSQTKENCAAYKAALQDFIDDCASSAGAAERDAFQLQLNNLSCQ